MRIKLLLSLVLLSIIASQGAFAEEQQTHLRISCTRQEGGCPCYQNRSNPLSKITYYYHKEPVIATSEPHDGYREIHREGEQSICSMEEVHLIAMNRPTGYTKISGESHRLIPLEQLLESDGEKWNLNSVYRNDSLDSTMLLTYGKKVSLGSVYPTYYHLALEAHYPGNRVDVKDLSGNVVARASQEFLDQVRWEGSGINDDGVHLHYTGIDHRFDVYSSSIWGYGAGAGYTVSPYRTIAVNLRAMCEKLYGTDAGCKKKEILGQLVYIPEIAEKKIMMENGSFHDGFFCITDTGSPDYIKEDRIDIFVGLHGGGNPYLPAARRGNALYNAGILSLVPWDWHLWESENSRLFCKNEKLPVDMDHPQPNDCTHDYHYNARAKRLTLYAMMTPSGSPVRCRKRLATTIAK